MLPKLALPSLAVALLLPLASACEPPSPTRAPIETAGPVAQLFEPILVTPSVGADGIRDDEDAIRTSSDALLLQFAERRVERERRSRLSEENRAMLLKPPPPGMSLFVRLWQSTGHIVIFSLRTPTEVRAAAVSRTDDDRLVPSIAWMSLALDVTGPSQEEKAAWYREIARRVATEGKATAIVFHPDGSATALVVAMQATLGDDSDVQLVARARRLEAAEAARDWGPKLSAAKVTTRKMNGHDGISIKDVLWRLGQPALPPPGVAAPLPPAAAATKAPAADVIPPDPTIVDRMCGTYCRRLAECQPGAGVPQCEQNCRERGHRLRPYFRTDYVDASVHCEETATCDVILHSSDQCHTPLRPPPTADVAHFCAWAGKQGFDCTGRTDGEANCLKGNWSLIRDDALNELFRRCEHEPCATRVHCLNASLGLPDREPSTPRAATPSPP
jgi:hypothetical protein